MDWIRILLSRCAGLSGRRKVDEDLDQELFTHIGFSIEENRRRGMSEQEARTAALRAFGGITQAKEDYRMQSGLPFFDVFSRDLWFGFRQLRKSPGFVWTTITIFGLGVGITTAAFSVIDGVLLRPLPYQDPDRLVWIHDGMTQEDNSGWSACMKDFLLWRARSKSFQNLSAFTGDRFALTGDGRAEELGGADVSAGFFATLGVRPLLGRTFAADADQPGRESEAMISERLWREKYGGRDDVLNKSITLDGRPVTVIGIMPSSFQFRLPDVDVWQILPLAPPVRRGPFIFHGVARLKQGVSLAQANAEMAGLARQVELSDPKGADHLHYPVESLRESILGDVRPLVRALAGAAFLVLLVSVFNIANLILARSVTRQQEIAIRLSIGAGFRRLLRQLLTESMMLALAGGAVGMLLAFLAIGALRMLAPPGIPRLDTIGMDDRVLFFTLIVSVLCGTIFGLVPAFAATRGDLTRTLKESGRGAGESRGHRMLRSSLVVAEITLSAVLLACAGLLIRSFLTLDNMPTGFSAPADRLIVMRISPSGEKYAQAQTLSVYWGEVLRRISGLPGVESSALAVWLPPDHSAMSDSFEIQGRTPPDGGPVVPVPIVTQGYFKTLQIPLVRGRSFDGRDTLTSPRVTIVSQNLARRYFPGEDPIGKQLKHGGPQSTNPYMEIVGVVGDVKYEGMAVPDEPVYYEASSQSPNRPMWLVVRAQGDTRLLIPAIRSNIAAIDSNVPVSNVGTMAEALYETVALPRFRSVLMGTFGALALLLAGIGIYGVMAYRVLRRTQEIAVRIALGATRSTVVSIVLRSVLMQTAIGLSLGILVALVAGHLISSQLYETKAYDPLIFIGVALVLTFCALMAGVIPARHAASIDPMRALRAE
jgi:putative ABC transport system permease protein